MPNCKNDPTNPMDRWDSYLGVNREGYFKIDSEDPVTGTFYYEGGGSETITGQCTAERILLERPSGTPQYRYVGAHVGQRLVGYRFSLSGARRRNGVSVLSGPDEWTGDNPTTFRRRRKTAGKKSSGKRASGKKAATKKSPGKKAKTKKRAS